MKEDGQCIFLSDVKVKSFVNLQPNNWINVNLIHIRDRKRKPTSNKEEFYIKI